MWILFVGRLPSKILCGSMKFTCSELNPELRSSSRA
ncbi:GSCOCG00012080001-RA-CDS [Cotesia congregata]|nr:GSCOCG00012080001-RA-CDS [Cotesia congregata]